MGSLRALFEVYTDGSGSINPDSLGWRSFHAAVGAHGLMSPLFASVLDSCRSRMSSQAKRVRFEDICVTSAALLPDPSVDKTLQDMQMDAGAVHKYVNFVRTTFEAGSFERKKMESSAEDLAQSFRGTLLHLLRLAAREAAALDALERKTLLSDPLAAAMKRASGGKSATLSSKALAVSPFDFQRTHAHAIAVRLAAIQLKPRTLRLQHRLYVGALGGGEGGAGAGAGGGTATSGGTSAAAAAAEGGVREASPEVLYATRTTPSYEDCAMAAVPYELEAVRLPPITSMDAIASASITPTAYLALVASLRGAIGCTSSTSVMDLDMPWDASGGGEEEGEEGGEGEEGPSSDAVLYEGAGMLIARGGFHLPSPSATPSTAPRAMPYTSAAVHTDYSAHSELVLSPYFADPCGIVEGSEEDSGAGVGAVMGLPSIFLYEFIPDQIPLSQILTLCGPLGEGRPLFRYLAREILCALCDIEAQCTFSLPTQHPQRHPITLDHVFLSECGARVTLRGVPWGPSIGDSPLHSPQALAQRSATLLGCYGAMIRSLLPSTRVTRALGEAWEGEVDGGGVWEGGRGRRQAAARVVNGEEEGEVGICLFLGETVGVRLGGGNAGVEVGGGGPAATFRAATASFSSSFSSTTITNNSNPSGASAATLADVPSVYSASLRSTSPVKRPGAGVAPPRRAVHTHSLWLPPILQLPGRAPGDSRSPAGHWSMHVTGGGDGEELSQQHLELLAQSHGPDAHSVSQVMAAASARAFNLGKELVTVHPPLASASSSGGKVELGPLVHGEHLGGPTFYLTGMGEGKGTLWFYCVDQEDEDEEEGGEEGGGGNGEEREEEEVGGGQGGGGEEVEGVSRGEPLSSGGKGERSGGRARRGGATTTTTTTTSSSSSGRKRSYHLFRPPPHPTRVVTEVRVPFTVLSPIPSPSLEQITAATDPQPKASPALATVRLLVSLIAKSRGIPPGSDEALVEVAGELAAVLQLNVSPTAPLAVGEPGALSNTSSSSSSSSTSSPRGGAGPSSSSSPSSSTEAGAAAADTLAALVEAIESGEGGEGGRGLGAMASASGEGGSGRHVKFSCHLARHDYFAVPLKVGGEPLSLEEERDLACDDFAAWAFPLRGGAVGAGGRRGRRL